MTIYIKQRFFTGRLVATFADHLLMFSIPLIVFKSTGSVAQSGLAFAIEWLPRVLSLPLAGSLADRLGGMKIFITSDVVRALVSLVAYFVLLSGWGDPFLTLSILAATLAFFAAQSQVSLETLVPKLTSPEDIPKSQSVLQGIDQISSIMGPLVGSMALIFASPLYLIALASLAYTLSALNLIFWRGSKILAAGLENKKASTDKRGNFIAGFRQIKGNGVLMSLTAFSMIANLVIGVGLAVMAAVATDSFGVSDSMYGWVGGVSGLVSVIVLFAVPRLAERFSLSRISGLGYTSCLGGALIAATAPNFWVYVFGHGMMLGGIFCFNVYMRTQRARLVESALLGRTVGAQMFLNQLILPVSGLVVASCSGALSSQDILQKVALLGIGLAFLVYSLPSAVLSQKAINS